LKPGKNLNIKKMRKEDHPRVCPVELAGGLDNRYRRLFQNPYKILRPYIKEGMTVLDFGCGPGFFSVEIARLLNDSGEVIAADLQEGMLDIVKQKVKGTELEKRIRLHKCQDESIGLTSKVDFVLMFYVVHEVTDQEKLFRELKSMLNPGGEIFIIEPKMHVTGGAFKAMTIRLEGLGFKVTARPKVFFSRGIVLAYNES
jgi:ubiquinone/menaquinone biosynthesis C-methylase UbiE